MSTPIVSAGDLILRRVNPGDLIKSDLINAIIQNIEALNTALAGVGGAGLVTVPNTIGRTLAEARTIIINPTTHMNMGGIIDVTGQSVSAVAEEAQVRRVVSQVPVPGARVVSGTAMSLVLSIRPGTGGGTPSDVPTIQSVAAGRIDEVVAITGNNFELAREQNQVFFAGVKANDPATATKTMLTVRIPDIGLPPGAPATEVDVLVRTPHGEASSKAMVSPRAQVPSPQVAEVSPVQVSELGSVTVKGTQFAVQPSQNEVLFGEGGASLIPQSGTPGSLTVVIPTGFFAPFNVQPGIPLPVRIRVRNLATGLTSAFDDSRKIDFVRQLVIR